MKRALITGITGQDGAYLAEFLLDKGYEVHGIKRRSSLLNTNRIDHLYEDPHEERRRLVLHYGDMTDSSSLIHIVQKAQPDEIYNLAGQEVAGGTTALSRPLHPHRFFLAQSDRTLVCGNHSEANPPRNLPQRRRPDQSHQRLHPALQQKPAALSVGRQRKPDYPEGQQV